MGAAARLVACRMTWISKRDKWNWRAFLTPEEEKLIPTVSYSLQQSLDALDKDREFLTRGDVMTDGMIDAYIALKEQEVKRFSMTPHPVEFDMYYSL